MSDTENIPPTGTDADASHRATTISTSDEKPLPRLTRPLSIRNTNTLSSQPDTARRAAHFVQKSEQNSQIVSICPQDVPLPQSDDTEGLLEFVEQSEWRSSTISDHDKECDQDQNDLSESNSTDDDFDFDDSDMILEDDDDIPLEDDPFFGDPTIQFPGQVTVAQLEEIRRVMQADAAQQKPDEEIPALDDKTPAERIGALLDEQDINPKAIVVNVGCSFARWIYLVVEPAEPLFEMKLKYIEAAELFDHLERLEFTFGSRVIGDSDTAEQLGIQQDSNLYCQSIDPINARNINERDNDDNKEPVADVTTRHNSSSSSSSSNINKPTIDVSSRRNSNESAPWNWSM